MWGRMGSAWVMHGACMGDAWPQEAVWPDGTGLHYHGEGPDNRLCRDIC